jgi:hypothetical protein
VEKQLDSASSGRSSTSEDFENALYNTNRLSSARRLESFCSALAGLMGGPSKNCEDYIFSADRSDDEKELAAAAFVRLAAQDDSFFSGTTTFGRGALRLLDDTLAPHKYAQLKLGRNSQTFEKIQQLQGLAPAAEKRVEEALSNCLHVECQLKR